MLLTFSWHFILARGFYAHYLIWASFISWSHSQRPPSGSELLQYSNFYPHSCPFTEESTKLHVLGQFHPLPRSCNVQNEVSESPRSTTVTHLEYRVHLQEPHFARGISQGNMSSGKQLEHWGADITVCGWRALARKDKNKHSLSLPSVAELPYENQEMFKKNRAGPQRGPYGVVLGFCET